MTKATNTNQTTDTAVDAKAITEAATVFNTKIAQNLTEASTRTWKDMISFGESMAAMQSNMLRQYSAVPGVATFADNLDKFHGYAAKSIATLTEAVTNLSK